MLKDHAIWAGTPVFILKFSFEFVAFFFCFVLCAIQYFLDFYPF